MCEFYTKEELTILSEYNVKARELTLGLSKLKQAVSMERCSFIIIDQVRANMKIESKWQQASQEKSVGDFGNFKAATAVSALQHHLRQWLFFSKGAQLKPNEPIGVDGWILNVFTEKNKLAPSQYSIPLVFDKKFGAIPFFSEYWFLNEITKTEKKFWKEDTKIIYPLCIKSVANSKVLTVYDPDNSKNVLYQSPKVTERNILNTYRDNQEFRYWFDRAVDISVDQRIKVALFRNDPAAQFRQNIEGVDILDNHINEQPILPEPTLSSQFDIDVDVIKNKSNDQNIQYDQNPFIINNPNIIETQSEQINPFATPDIGEYEPISPVTCGRLEI